MSIIAKYKFNQGTYSNLLPKFNSEFTDYTYNDEIDTDGYTIRTIGNDSGNLPTLIRFGSGDGGLTSTQANSLLSVEYIDTSKVTDMSNMFYKCSSLASLDTSNFNTSKVTNMNGMFRNCNALTSLDLSNFSTSLVTNMNNMFYNCSSLTSLDLSNFNNGQVDNMSNMFYNCNALTSLGLSNFNTSQVTNMNNMFYNCTSLTSLDVSNFNTAQVTDMSNMFYNCSSLASLDVSNFNTGNVTNMSSMFYKCSLLASLDVSNFNTGNVKNMSSMFYNCSKLTSLDLSSFNTSNVTNMGSMFDSCSKLTSLDLSNFNTNNVTNMSSMFQNCKLLASLDVSNFDTSKVTNMSAIFFNCAGLTSLDLSNFDTSLVTNKNTMFNAWTSSQKVYISSKWTLGTSFSPTFVLTFANIIAKYKFNQNTYESFIPTFNTDFTDYTYTDEIDTDGYTIRTLGNDSGNLPTLIRFGQVTVNGETGATNKSLSLLEVYKCNTSNITDMNSMFRYCTNLTSLDVSSFNTSDVTYMGYMFQYCSSLTSLDLSNFNTSNVNNMNNMFSNCKSLTSLNVSNFNTGQVTSMYNMFGNCTSLTPLDLSNFNTSNVDNMKYMFSECTSLTSLDLSNFNTSKVTNMSYMFRNCSKLISLDVSSFDTSLVTDMSYMFYYCYSLTSLDLTSFETKNVTDKTTMFGGWASNQKVYASSKWTLGTSFPPTFIITFANIIAKYKFNQNTYANFIPQFNSEFTDYTYTDEIDTDGYTIRTLGNDSGGLPTLIRFGTTDISGSGDYTKQHSLLEVNNLNTSNVTDMSLMFYQCKNLARINTSFNTGQVTNMQQMFCNCKSLISLDVSNFNTSKVIDMRYMFNNCPSLASLNISNFDTSQVNNMSNMFNSCTSLTSLDLSDFNTSKVTDMNSMFYNCSKLTSLDLSNFNTSQVTNMKAMFTGCYLLATLDLSNFDTSQVTDISGMFQNCISLTSLDLSNFDTGEVISMTNVFNNCIKLTSLNVSNFNTGKVNNMQGMFGKCSSLTSLDLSNFRTTKELLSMNSMFQRCTSLTELDLSSFYTNNVTDFSNLFNDCSNLVTLDISNFHFGGVNQNPGTSLFSGCNSLKNIAMIYCRVSSFSSLQKAFNNLIATPVNVYYHDANLSELPTHEKVAYQYYGTPTVTLPYELNKLPNGVADYIDVVNGVYVQRVGKFITNGTEAWRIGTYANASINDQCTIFIYNIKDKKGVNNDARLCDKWTLYNTDIITIANIEGIHSGGNDDSFFINVSNSKATTVEQWKAYLQSNPFTYMYELKEPIYTPLTDEEKALLPLSAYSNGYIQLSSDELRPSKFEFRAKSSNRMQLDMLETGHYYLNAPTGNVKLGNVDIDVTEMPCLIKVDNASNNRLICDLDKVVLSKLPSHRIPTTFTQGMKSSVDFGYWEGFKEANCSAFVPKTVGGTYGTSIGMPTGIVLNRLEYGSTVVEDEFDISTGKHTKRVGKTVLDGTQEIHAIEQVTDNDKQINVCIKLNDAKYKSDINSLLYCDKLYVSRTFEDRVDCIKLYGQVLGYMEIRLMLSKAKVGESNNSVKAWLSNNPITIYYELETPEITYYDLSANSVSTMVGTTIIETWKSMSSDLFPQCKPAPLSYPTTLSPNTQYTVFHNRKNYSGSVKTPMINLGGTEVSATGSRTVVTTPSTLAHNELRFIGGENTVEQVMVLHGDWTKEGKTVDYFEGLQSSVIGDKTLENLVDEPTDIWSSSVTNASNGGAVDYVSMDDILVGYGNRPKLPEVQVDTDVCSYGMTLQNLVESVSTNTDEVCYNLILPYNAKQNTTYTFICDVDFEYGDGYINEETNSGIYCGFLDSGGGNWNHTTCTFYGGKQYKGKVVIKVTTTNSTGNKFRVRFYQQDVLTKWLANNFMILEGDYTNIDIPFFEGMKSVENPVLTTTGKNLFDFSSEKIYNGLDVNDVVIKNNTIEVSASSEGVWKNVGFRTKVKPNTQYTFSVSNREYTTDGFNFIAIYTTGDSALANTGSNNSNNSLTVTTPSDCNEIIIQLYATGSDAKKNVTSTYENPMLEESSTATSYKPYKSNILSTPQGTVLRGVGSYKDVIGWNDGIIRRNCVEFTITGEEGYSISVTENTNTILCGITWKRLGLENKILSNNNVNMVICDKLPSMEGNGDTPHIRQDGTLPYSEGLWFWLDKTKFSTYTSQGINDYIKSIGGLTIVAPLANTEYEDIEITGGGNWREIVLDETITNTDLLIFNHGTLYTTTDTHPSTFLDFTLKTTNRYTVKDFDKLKYTVLTEQPFYLNGVDYPASSTGMTIIDVTNVVDTSIYSDDPMITVVQEDGSYYADGVLQQFKGEQTFVKEFIRTSNGTYNTGMTLLEPLELNSMSKVGVYDYYNPITGEVIKNTGKITITGNESYWDGYFDYITDTSYASYSPFVCLAQIPALPYNRATSTQTTVNNLGSDNVIMLWSKECNEIVIGVNGTNLVVIRVPLYKMEENSPKGLQKFVQENPITLVYKLKTPQIIQATPTSTYISTRPENGNIIAQDTQIQAEYLNYDNEQSIISPRMLGDGDTIRWEQGSQCYVYENDNEYIPLTEHDELFGANIQAQEYTQYVESVEGAKVELGIALKEKAVYEQTYVKYEDNIVYPTTMENIDETNGVEVDYICGATWQNPNDLSDIRHLGTLREDGQYDVTIRRSGDDEIRLLEGTTHIGLDYDVLPPSEFELTFFNNGGVEVGKYGDTSHMLEDCVLDSKLETGTIYGNTEVVNEVVNSTIVNGFTVTNSDDTEIVNYTLPTPITLRKVGDVCDTFDVVSGVQTINTVITTITGSSHEFIENGNQNKYRNYIIRLKASEYMTKASRTYVQNDDMYIYTSSNSQINIYVTMYKKDGHEDTYDHYRQLLIDYLNNNPLTIMEEAYTPITTQHTLIPSTTQTTQEPTFILPQPLRSVPNGICDRLYWDENKGHYCIEKRIGKLVLDGTIQTIAHGGYSNTDYVEIHIPFTTGALIENVGYCEDSSFTMNPYNGSSYRNSINYKAFAISMKKTGLIVSRNEISEVIGEVYQNSNSNQLKTYLSLKPVTLLIPLATPQIIDLPHLDEKVELPTQPNIYPIGYKAVHEKANPEIGLTIPYKVLNMPTQPTNLNFVMDIADYVLTWDDVKEARQYNVILNDNVIATVKEPHWNSGEEMYGYVLVEAQNELGDSLSKELYIKTVPNAPAQLTVAHNPQTDFYDFEISFIDTSEIAEYFTVMYRVDNGEWVVEDIPTTDLELNTKVLIKFSIYEIKECIEVWATATNDVGTNDILPSAIYYMSPTPQWTYRINSKEAFLRWLDESPYDVQYKLRYSYKSNGAYQYAYFEGDASEIGKLYEAVLPLAEDDEVTVALCIISEKENLYSKPVTVSKALDPNIVPPLNFNYHWLARGLIEFYWEDQYNVDVEYEYILESMKSGEALWQTITEVIPSRDVSGTGEVYRVEYQLEDLEQIRMRVRMKWAMNETEWSETLTTVFIPVEGNPPTYIRRTQTAEGLLIEWEAQSYIDGYHIYVIDNKTGEELQHIETLNNSILVDIDYSKSIEIAIYEISRFSGGIEADATDPMVFTPTMLTTDIEQRIYQPTMEEYFIETSTVQKGSKEAYIIHDSTYTPNVETEEVLGVGISTPFIISYHPMAVDVHQAGSRIENTINTHIKTLDTRTEELVNVMTFERTTATYDLDFRVYTPSTASYPINVDISKVRIVCLGDSLTSGHPFYWE